MLDRLIGLETEYATLVRLPLDQDKPPSRREVYEAVCKQISLRIPTARGRFDTDTIFLANGGAFSMEGSPARMHLPGGLIEGATAETSSPSRLVECQRAQDRLIAEAAAECDIPGTVRIVKNSCDAHGHVYGCQENYSAIVAKGPELWLYWGLMALVLPFALFYWTVCLSLLAAEMSIMAGIRGGCRLLHRRDQRYSQQPAPASVAEPLPQRLLFATALLLRVLSLPVAGLLYISAKTFAFRRQRKYLTSFLVSRVILTGAGHVDRANRFRLSSKAMAIDTVTGFGGYLNERPIYVFHHWLHQLCGRSLISTRSMTELFRKQQRLQIGLSDSNLSDTAEFLKVGTTSLVLDLIESGGGRELPRLIRPIEALHRIAGDWDLVARVATTRGEMSGLEIQRAYLKACRRFVKQQTSEPTREVLAVLQRWEETLDALALFRSTSIDPRPALGHIDWLTKKWMLDRLDDKAVGTSVIGQAESAAMTLQHTKAKWTARKKVDIRYHELSEDGYYARLKCISPEVCSVDPEAIEHALRLPPVGSPAMRRGQLIREFSNGTQDVTADWSHVVIGTGKNRKVVSIG